MIEYRVLSKDRQGRRGEAALHVKEQLKCMELLYGLGESPIECAGLDQRRGQGG